MKKRLLILLAIAALVAGFYALGLNDYLSLEQLKASQARFAELLRRHPVAIPAAYVVIYVLVTAASLPGAAIMTLAGGALFGLWQGLLLVSFASSIGATLAFLVARFLLRETVRTRFGQRLKAIDRGVQRDGALYLFTLRLVPIFPFFIINLVMGLTRLRTWTFYWISQVGMLAGSAVYVNAGTQLARVERVGDILSPQLLLSFVLLGLFPWIARAIVGLVQRRRVYRRWRRPRRFDRNLVVIGAGAQAGELLAEFILAMRHGLGLNKLLGTIHSYPTLAEANKYAAGEWKKAHAPERLLDWVERYHRWRRG